MDFSTFINKHRYELDLRIPTAKEEIYFYSTNIDIFIDWLYDSVSETRYRTYAKVNRKCSRLLIFSRFFQSHENVDIVENDHRNEGTESSMSISKTPFTVHGISTALARFFKIIQSAARSQEKLNIFVMIRWRRNVIHTATN